MSVLRSMDKLPDLNRATVLLVSTEDALLQQLADAMLREDCASELRVEMNWKVGKIIKVLMICLFQDSESSLVSSGSEKSHLAKSLPLPYSVNRPRIDLIVFVINLHSKYSLQSVEGSLQHVDSSFFLGKVCFLVTGAGQESHCSIHRSTVVKLAHTYRCPLLFCDLEMESFRATMAQRLVRMLQICAGHVPGVSALNLPFLLRSSESTPLEEL